MGIYRFCWTLGSLYSALCNDSGGASVEEEGDEEVPLKNVSGGSSSLSSEVSSIDHQRPVEV